MNREHFNWVSGLIAGLVLGIVGVVTMGAGGSSSYSVTTDGSQVLITDNSAAVLYVYTTSGSGWTLNGSVDLRNTGSASMPVVVPSEN